MIFDPPNSSGSTMRTSERRKKREGDANALSMTRAAVPPSVSPKQQLNQGPSLRDAFPWFLALGYAIVFSVLGAIRYAVHKNYVDFGIFLQTSVSAFGCFCNQIEGSHWAFHFSPILYVVGAILAVWHSPLVLVFVQAVAGALTLPAVYGLVRRRSDGNIARLATLVVALYPALGGLVFNDFHENGFAPAAVTWLLWAFDGGFIGATCIFALITLCIKEDQAIFLAIAGAVGAWRLRGTPLGRMSGAISIASLAVFVLFFFVIQPHAALESAWAPVRFYSWTAADFHDLFFRGILTRLGFIVLVFAPLMFLPFRSSMLWLAVPPLAEVLLSRIPTTYTMGTHYTGAWIGYVIVAFAFALRALPGPVAKRMLFGCLALCIMELAVADPLHPGMTLRPIQKRDVALDRALGWVPRNASVATQEEAYSHLALTDPQARLLPEQSDIIPSACYVLIDNDYPHSVILLEYGKAFRRLVKDGVYRLIRREGNIALYHRIGICK